MKKEPSYCGSEKCRIRVLFIGIDLNELPIVPSLDVFRIVVDLRLVACELFIVVSGDPGVSGNAALPALANGRGGEGLQRCRYGFYFPLLFQNFSLLIFFIC